MFEFIIGAVLLLVAIILFCGLSQDFDGKGFLVTLVIFCISLAFFWNYPAGNARGYGKLETDSFYRVSAVVNVGQDGAPPSHVVLEEPDGDLIFFKVNPKQANLLEPGVYYRVLRHPGDGKRLALLD